MNKQDSYTFPEDFIKRIRIQFGEQADEFLNSMEKEPSVTVRLNNKKFSLQEKIFEHVQWCPAGVFLKERPVFTLDPLFHAGAYYVQEASSMFLEQAFRATGTTTEGRLILDLCGAPGGKSTHLLSLMNDNDLLVSNEVILSRIKILRENIRKWGAPNVIIANNDPKDFGQLNGFFDLILVDAPCSGEGLFKRDPAARNEWSPGNAQLCSVRQRRIVADIWPALKTGGYLIYSTCTFNPEENEENLKWLKSQNNFKSIRIPLKPEWHIEETETDNIYGYHFFPHLVKSEGFFIAVLQKTDDEPASRFPKKMRNKPGKIPAGMAFVKNWVQAGNYEFRMINDTIVASPEQWQNEIDRLSNSLKITDSGLPVATLKGKDTVPAHELVLSSVLNISGFGFTDINFEEALKYLRKEEIKLHTKETGWQIVRFRNTPIGLVKNIGTRVNNYYPKEWRIRMQTTQAGKPWYE